MVEILAVIGVLGLATGFALWLNIVDQHATAKLTTREIAAIEESAALDMQIW